MCPLPDAILEIQAKLLSTVLAGAMEHLSGHPHSERKRFKALEVLALLNTPQEQIFKNTRHRSATSVAKYTQTRFAKYSNFYKVKVIRKRGAIKIVSKQTHLYI